MQTKQVNQAIVLFYMILLPNIVGFFSWVLYTLGIKKIDFLHSIDLMPFLMLWWSLVFTILFPVIIGVIIKVAVDTNEKERQAREFALFFDNSTKQEK